MVDIKIYILENMKILYDENEIFLEINEASIKKLEFIIRTRLSSKILIKELKMSKNIFNWINSLDSRFK